MGGAAVFIATSAMQLRYGKEMCAGQDCMGANPALSHPCRYGWVGQALFVRGKKQAKLSLVRWEAASGRAQEQEAPHVNGSGRAWVRMSPCNACTVWCVRGRHEAGSLI